MQRQLLAAPHEAVKHPASTLHDTARHGVAILTPQPRYRPLFLATRLRRGLSRRLVSVSCAVHYAGGA
jgi:hypothetical protein